MGVVLPDAENISVSMKYVRVPLRIIYNFVKSIEVFSVTQSANMFNMRVRARFSVLKSCFEVNDLFWFDILVNI